MKILLDQCLGRETAELLRQAGHEAIHVGEIGMATADDSTIITHARQHGQVIVTADVDLHSLIMLSGATSPSVIRIRIQGLSATQMFVLTTAALKACASELAKGALISVLPNEIRTHTLGSEE